MSIMIFLNGEKLEMRKMLSKLKKQRVMFPNKPRPSSRLHKFYKMMIGIRLKRNKQINKIGEEFETIGYSNDFN